MALSAHTVKLAWHRRLEARVVGAVGVLVAVSIGSVVVATTAAVRSRSLERASSDLEAARSAFSRLADDRAEFASAQAALVTALPVFRAHMTDSHLAADVATLRVLADEYRGQLKADFCLVGDRHGTWMAVSGWPADGEPLAIRPPAADSAARPSRTIVPIRDRMFLVVTEPARFGDEVLGSLTVGYALDDGVAKRLSDETHCDVGLVAGRVLYASSLPPRNRTALSALIARDELLETGIASRLRRVGTDDYIVGRFPLSPDQKASNHLVLLQDWQPTADFVAEIRRRLLFTGAGVLALALAGSVAVSRRMTRPVEDLAAAAEDIASGNWTRQVAVEGSAEAVMMAQAVNQMTTSLRHWSEMAQKRERQDQQAKKMEAIGRLAGGIAHDFNNVLMAINGYGHLLRESLDRADERRNDADEILKATKRAAGLIRQLLAFARRQIVQPRILALDQVVESVKPMLQQLIGEDVVIATVVKAPLGAVRADAQQIDQVLINLAVNARDAMPDGGHLRIEIANESLTTRGGRTLSVPAGRYVRLSVTDTGCGMSQETLVRIFEPFFTTKEEGKGTGLGLATVHGIVDKAGGVVDVESEVNRGTSFHVYLPEVPWAGEAPGAAGAPADGEVSRGSETILVVEDDRAVGTLICAGLRKAGYAVLEASGGAQALEMVHAHATPIHLLVTDVVMPGMNGRVLSERVLAESPDTRVLFMSGHSDDAILRHGVTSASVPFIHKPFSVEELTARIRQVLPAAGESRPS